MQLLQDEPLLKHTYYRIGGPADTLAIPNGLDELRQLASEIKSTHQPYLILGLGSNVLVSDQGFRGTVIKCSRIDLNIAAVGTDQVRIGSSVAVSTLLRRAAQEGWAGLEFLTGVPGSIGGVVVMNAGTHLGAAKDALLEVEYFSMQSTDGSTHKISGQNLKFEYRKNLFLPTDAVVVSTLWKITRDHPAQVKAKIDELLQRRKSTQPVDYPSCGSVFKNPKSAGMHAWQVIEKLGLRGHQLGQAQFSQKHPNFIVNLGGARAQDVRSLIELAKKRALDELQVTLEEEVKYIGEF